MGDLTKYIKLVNQCFIPDPPNAPSLNMEKIEELMTDEEWQEFEDAVISQIPFVQFYRTQFYTLEYKDNSDVVLMRDENREVHTIMNNGKVIWTKERFGITND